MKNLKIINQEELKDWAKEIFKKNSFNMVDVSSKKETFRRALASGKIYVGKEVFNLIMTVSSQTMLYTTQIYQPHKFQPYLTLVLQKLIYLSIQLLGGN